MDLVCLSVYYLVMFEYFHNHFVLKLHVPPKKVSPMESRPLC
jgi:hypothetical protein